MMNRRQFLHFMALGALGGVGYSMADKKLLEVLYHNTLAAPANLENLLEDEIETGSYSDGRTESLDVTTYNIHDAKDIGVLDDIKNIDSDIIMLQEVPHYKQGVNLPKKIAKENHMDYSFGLMIAYENNGRLHDKSGLVTLSRYPIIDTKVIRLRLGFEWKNNWGRVGGPIALRTDIKSPKGVMALYCTHLDNRTTPSFRGVQMLQILDDAPKDNVIIGGDLNVIFQGILDEPAVSYLKQSGFSEPKIEGYSMRLKESPYLRFLGIDARLDRIYSKGIQPIGGKVLTDKRCSDHFPVRVEYGV